MGLPFSFFLFVFVVVVFVRRTARAYFARSAAVRPTLESLPELLRESGVGCARLEERREICMAARKMRGKTALELSLR